MSYTNYNILVVLIACADIGLYEMFIFLKIFVKMFVKTNRKMAEVPITLSHRLHSTATAEMQQVSIVFDINQVGA